MLGESTADGSRLQPVLNTTWKIQEHELCSHFLCAGKTGSGKTTRFLLPFLDAALATGASVVVFDVGLNLSPIAARMANRHGRPASDCLYVNFLDVDSLKWNPLESVTRRDTAREIASALAGTPTPPSGDGDFFRIQGEGRIASAILSLNKLHHGSASLGLLRELFEAGGERIREAGMKGGAPDLVQFGKELTEGNRNSETTLGEIINRLQSVFGETPLAVTSSTEIQFGCLEERPTLLVLGVPEEKARQILPLNNLFLTRLMDWILSTCEARSGPLKRPIIFLLDEFTMLGRLAGMEDRANTLRKRRVSLIACSQTPRAQLSETYGGAATALFGAFNNLVFIPPITTEDAALASERTGWMSVAAGGGQCMERRVLMPCEIDGARTEDALGPKCTFLLEGLGLPPFQGYLQPIYRRRGFSNLLRPAARSEWVKGYSRATCSAVKGLHESLPFVQANRNSPAFGRSSGSEAGPAVVWNHGRALDQMLGLLKECADQRERILSEFESHFGTRTADYYRRLKETMLEAGRCSRPARDWWKEFERDFRGNPGVVHRFAWEMASRGITIEDAHACFLEAGTMNLQGLLHYAEHRRLKHRG